MASTPPPTGPALYAEPAALADARAVLHFLAGSPDIDVEARLAVLQALEVLRGAVPAGTVQPELTARPGTLETARHLLDQAARDEPDTTARLPISVAAACLRRALEDQ